MGKIKDWFLSEKEADDLIIKWGFNRTNKEVYKDKVK